MIAIDKTPVENRGEALSQIWWRGKQWAVTEYGLECLDGTYAIQASLLRKDMPKHPWVAHMSEKNWVDIAEFNTAFMVALLLHENEQVREMILRGYQDFEAGLAWGRKLR